MKTLNDLLGDEGAATVLRQRCEELTQDKLSLLKKVRDMGAEIETLKAGRESLRSERDMAHERGSEMDKMREWNRLCELELANLRMLNEGLTSELEHLKGSAYTYARAYRDKEFHALETVLATTEKELAECNRDRTFQAGLAEAAQSDRDHVAKQLREAAIRPRP